jgi:VanZ family protein
VTEASPPPYRWSLVVGALVLAVYLATLAPTTAFWDTSEYIAAAKVLGIPHPPGNPLFTLMAHVWGLIPLAASYAVRINIFAAVTSAVAAAMWFLVAERWMRDILPHRAIRLAAAAAGTLVGAAAWTVWNQSTVNEKVYTVSLMTIAIVAWLTVRWADAGPGPRRDRLLILMVYVMALSSTNHMMGVLVLPLVAVYVLFTDWRSLLKPAVIVAIALVVVIGISINYVYLPMRAGQYPPINEGEPAGFFSQALQEVLSREQYGKPSVFQRMADPLSQLRNYLQYFNWQFARDWGALQALFTAVFTALGLTGLWALIRTRLRDGLAAAALLFTLTLLLVYYLNFRYGYSVDPGLQLDREVRERDYFFIASFSFFGVLVALGMATTMRAIVEWLGDRGTERSRWIAATPVLLLGLVPLIANRLTASRAHETLAHDFAVDLLESVEPYGILITAGDNDTFPLWFAQEVEGVRTDVTLANLSLMNTRWHLRQLRRRPTPDFNPATAADLWQPRPDEPVQELRDTSRGNFRGLRWPRPASDVLALSEVELSDTTILPDVVAAPDGVVRVGEVQIRFGTDVLLLADVVTALLISNNLGKRPIYFAWSAAGYPDQTLGLSPYLVTHGFVRRLQETPVEVGDSVVASPLLGFVNVPRTNALLWETYNWAAATRSRPHGWVDPPSGSILQLYSIIYGGMAPILAEAGEPGLAARADSIAGEVRRALNPGR